MAGVGKTTVGKATADKVLKSFLDLDRSIELHCGVDIQTIFSIEGETGFRHWETEALRRIVTQRNNYVLSIGGGCILRSENRELLINKNNLVVQLYADINILVHRLSYSPSKRPLFNQVGVEDKVKQLCVERQKLYDNITDIKINTSKLRPSQVADIIANSLK